MVKSYSKTEILKMVQEMRITPEEGFDLIKELEKGNGKRKQQVYLQDNTSLPKAKAREVQPQVYDIAVIGMSGRFSGAENLDVFWDNLKKGVSSIGEVPRERWDINEYYHPNPKTPNKTYCKWLGLVPDADKFDPLFFNISPREAELMDPQHRLILEETWRALEDAGYSPGFFSGTKCGVFIGVMQGDYDQRLSGSGLDIQSVTGNLNSFIPARVSYFLNLLGPNMAIDTACSSSLVAVHQACKSIQSGESELALAGGVCIITTPATHISTSNGEMLSRDGKCKTFDNSADGFVPGEGVGVVALKALAKAIEDGDHIYGIIKGSRVNQDGKTNGITAPSSNSQAQLEAEVYETFGINPESISYVEAHGTGTKLGDPIEVSALTRSFRRHTEKKQYCAIGSVKTNIGHGLAAAGIAGLIKVLLCMKHNKIVPSLHFNKANEHINFKDSPFYVNTELKDWETEGPRRAAISSFGLSGTNCHMVVEEAPNTNIDGGGHQTAQAIIVLSAKKRERLLDQARQLLAAISEQQFSGLSLAHIAYTLQVGRQAMEERLAVLVSSIEELKEKLQGFVEGKDGIADMYRGQVRKNRETLAVFAADEELQEVINKWAQRGKYSKLLDLWVKGLAVDWSKLYEGGKPRRVSLPTYPFARERYWITGSQINTGDTTGKALAADSAIHPLLHKNTSDLTEQRFSSTFTGREFFLADHVVKGQSVLPGAACLEMARAAVEKAAGVSKEGKVGIRLKNVVWTRPVVVEDQPVRVHIGLFPEDNGEISYQIYTVAVEDAEPVVHSQGAAVLSPLTEVPVLDINVLLAECSLGSLSPVQCYQAFRSAGIDYGPGHQGIEKVYVGSGKVLAKLSLPLAVAGTLGQYTLHPGLLDSALQAAIGLLMDGGTAAAGSIGQLHPSLPFALQEIEIYSACASLMWALIRYSSGSAAGDKVQKLDIDVCDSEGKVCVRMRGFSSRVLENEAALAEPAKAVGTLMLQPTWKEQAIGREAQASAWEHRLVILCEPGKASLERMEKQSGVRCIALQTEQTGIAERFQTYAGRVFEEIQGILKDKIKGHVLVQVAVDSRDEGQLFSGLSGILKTARLENPKLMGQLIEVTDWEEIVKILDENSQSPLDSHVRYQDGKRRVAGWSQIEVLREEAGIPWEDKGVYLITGGAGGLGLILAGEIAQKVKGAALILTGRSPLGAGRQAKLKELEELGARIEYRQADVTRKEAVEDLIQSILEHFGKLNGIIHSAGVTRDSYIQKQTGEELQEVLGPKVAGLVNLDHSSREIGLDFLVLFSSIAGGLGNIGQAGYSAANAFMDAYAGYRNALVAAQQRQGKTLSVNWPLWKDGGMGVDEETEKLMLQNTGMIAMRTSTGIRALYQALACGPDQIMVLEGRLRQMKQKLLLTAAPALSKAASHQPKEIDDGGLLDKVKTDLIQTASGLLKVKNEDIDAGTHLNEYGFDSITLTEFVNKINQNHRLELLPTIFFEHPTIHSFAEYLVKEHRERFERVSVSDSASEDKAEKTQSPATQRSRFVKTVSAPAAIANTATPEAIAIIGMSGRFPMARDVHEFWINLVEGRDCITEIPKERWDWREYYGDPKKEANKTNVKWGGFIDGVDHFNPLFFGISPMEAELMDPQQRLLMTYVWKAIEDAGYSAGSLSGTKTAIFAGTSASGYSSLISQAKVAIEGHTSTGSVPSVGPNRMSYYLNIHGPSEPIETACSSSLVAIHRAVSAINDGSCEMAIVGGVNTIVTPEAHISFSKAGMLCEDGRCKTFSDKANGYVRGEGVGMLFLKKLKDAEEAGDHIYGVIRGTSVNHGGRANSLTAPNPKAQAELLVTAYKKAGIDPRTVSYIEAHGTGTELGDPIEINGLKAAFKELYHNAGIPEINSDYCGLGSVKTNIGHLELAAGVAGVIKVLLQLKHKTLVKSLHSDTLNPYIQLNDSPFYIVRDTKEWDPLQDSQRKDVPRRAGISSFGFGGVNAHVVIEEYLSQNTDRSQIKITPQSPAIIVLSAKNEERVKDQAQRLLTAIREEGFSDSGLADMAYTLQVGREAMEERLAVIVGSIKELEEKLKAFLEERDGIEDLYRGQVKRNKDALAVFTADEDLQKAIESWISKGKYTKLSDLWVKGLAFDWNRLYGDIKPRRISLPTYPFARERYWIPEMEVCGRMKGLSSGALEDEEVEIGPAEAIGALLLQPVWKEQPIAVEGAATDYEQHLVLLCEPGEAMRESIKAQMNGVRCLTLKADHKEIDKQFQAYATRAFEEIQSILKEKPKGKALVQVITPTRDQQQLFTGLTGLLKTAGLENPKLIGQLIEMEVWQDTEKTIEMLKENSQSPHDSHIRYQGGKRYVAGWSEIETSREAGRIPWKDRGVYLITGGAGGLGLIFAGEIVKQVKDAALILTGRSPLKGKKQDKLKELEASGVRIEYRQVDVTRKKEVDDLVQSIREIYGSLDGIIHSAGVIKDSLIIKKTKEEFKEVLAPKVTGLVNLDGASKGLSLDFFIFFSSGAGASGNPGQADYAAANAFMDAYARYRGTLAESGQRQGKTLSINWPLWKEGGMRVDEETEKMMMKSMGMAAMQTSTGIRAFYQGFALAQNRVMVIEGRLQRLKEILLKSLSKANKNIEREPIPKVDPELLREKTLHQLKALFGSITKLSTAKIDAESLLENYGINSIIITRLNQKLYSIFGELSKTLFFEYQTLRDLTEYFVTEHPKECIKWAGIAVSEHSIPEAAPTVLQSNDEFPPLTSFKAVKKTNRCTPVMDLGSKAREPIAIIGISGRYPEADNLREYWENIKAGKDCITEIPKERWPLEGFYHPNPEEAVAQGKSYCKWGGFVKGFAGFDPLFFNISPREALNMDPQERLFIEACWEALEDAAYTREQLAAQYNRRVGVFAGITKTGFDLYGPHLWKQGEQLFPRTSFGSLANRVSYLFNLQGPSMPIDTMCSSSLTAIHEACEHILRGECEMAIAGGVNLYLHPSNYIALCGAQMLSADGKCKSFGQGGNGFVPGEGVGAVLLKRLSRAIAEEDHIYGVIRGTSINHGGKTNGYTVPNPTAQGELIREALDKAGVDARAISYIEAHGTGTELGDPIEITGLTQAFRKDTRDQGYCAIGSVKSNIGHLEAAAGVAGLTKIVLQMKHQKIAPSLHAKDLNPNINFAKTPFVINQELTEWKRPVIDINGEAREYPRIAGISSFGAGGANAHLIIEEYTPPGQVMANITVTPQSPAIIVLSAKNEERLKNQAKRLLAVIREEEFSGTSLADMAYTLQVGREAMEERLAVIAGSIKELEEKLNAFLEEQDGIEDLYRGQVKRNKETFSVFTADEDMANTIDAWITKGKYAKLVNLWVKGLVFDWNRLYGDKKPSRISLPTYPFAKERYWIPEMKAGPSGGAAATPVCIPMKGLPNRVPEGEIETGAVIDAIDAVDAEAFGEPPVGTIMLTPVWDLVYAKKGETFSPPTEQVVIMGGTKDNRETIKNYYPKAGLIKILPGDTIDQITEKLKGHGSIDHIVWIAPYNPLESVADDTLIEGQNQGVLQFFRIIKALLGLGYGTRDVSLTVITMQAQFIGKRDKVNPTHASIHGFVGSMKKEYPGWRVRLVDLEAGCDWPVNDIFTLPGDARGNAWAYRGGEWYRQQLIPVHYPQLNKTLYKFGGVYVVIGGAGGIGEAWSEYMMRSYQARIIWIGRRHKDEAIQAKLDRLSAFGPAPYYITADATDRKDLHRAHEEIKKIYSKIDGLIHSVILLLDKSLANMEEERFHAGLAAKVDVSVRIAQVFQKESLDFVLFFSSLQSYSKSPGQSNYASGCTFKDAFAHRLSQEWPCTVKVMNWGYWGSVGVVANKAYQDRMAQAGLGSIEPPEAMEALETLLAGPMSQIAFLKTVRPLDLD